ncbi:MAG TPA: nucleoid-associated protein [Bradyrhizobium sp.]|nr:nucleoid-associated protein [Bradyrhizobium sp.]
MSFENLVVEKVVLHEVFKRRLDGSLITPRYAGQLVALPADAMGSFTERVVDAMGDASQSMELEIAESGPDSAVGIAVSLVREPDAAFIARSAKFADKLANAQQAKNLPGGILVVFTGTVEASSRPFVGVIKAEKQSGFRERGTAIQYLTDLFLTPASKLYKIGFFTLADARRNLPDGWRAHVYDSHMTQRNRDGAAKYFYGTFLGCKLPMNSAYLTRSFFENTREFIRQLSVEPEVKDDLLTSLYTYLKIDQTPTIQVNSFSTAYLPNEAQDDYTAYMRSKKFPLTAVQKDIADLKGKLQKRRVRFSGSIELSGPPEAFKDLIHMETVVADGAEPGQSAEWTRITIKDRIRAQE